MSSSIQLAGTSFSRAITSLTLPDRRDCVGEYIFGGSQAASIINLANAAAPLTPIVAGGAATYNPHSAIVQNNTGSNAIGFNTGITPYYDCTLILIRKTAVPQYMLIMGGEATDGTGTSYGIAQLSTSEGAGAGFTPATSVSASASRVVPATGFFFSAAVLQQGAKSTLYAYTAGVIGNTQSAAARSMSPAVCQIGANTWGSPQTCEIAYAAIINRILTSAEVDAAGQSLKAYFAALGVTVA